MRIVTISWVSDILFQFYLIVDFFSRIFSMEVSLILRVLPRYIGCYYHLLILFPVDCLNHPAAFSFPKDWLSHLAALSFSEG